MINHDGEEQRLLELDPLPVGPLAVLVGASGLEVVHPAHARVILHEAVDDRFLHEVGLALATAATPATLAILELLHILLEQLDLLLQLGGRVSIRLLTRAQHDHLPKPLVRVRASEARPSLGENRESPPKRAEVTMRVIEAREHHTR